MSDPFIGQIKLFAGNFAPRGYAFCDGQLLPIAQHTALFAIVGTIYGGDGRTTLGLPDLRGRAPLHAGTGPGLSNRSEGQKLGSENETLSAATMPTHTHQLKAIAATSTAQAPAGNTSLAQTAVGGRGGGGTTPYGPAANLVNMSPMALGAAGGGQAHGNIQPRLAVNYIIALQGTFPSRS